MLPFFYFGADPGKVPKEKTQRMSDTDFKDKFIGFVDILGFKKFVEAAEAGTGMSLAELLELLRELGTVDDRRNLEKYGPTICPTSAYRQRDLDFRLTQISDCVVVSTEVSPAGDRSVCRSLSRSSSPSQFLRSRASVSSRPTFRRFGVAACLFSALRIRLVWLPSASALWPCPSCLSCRPYGYSFLA